MKVAWLSPGDPAQRTGGYLWNARMVEELRALGAEVEVVALPGAWPRPGLESAEPLESIRADRVVADGLCWPGCGEAGRRLAARAPVAVLVHSPLGAEPGPARDRELDAWEAEAWEPARLRIATSGATLSELRERGGPPAVLVIPGTDRVPQAPGGDGRTILTVGTLTRRKGHDRLLEALERVARPWRLVCAGAPRDPAWAGHLAREVERRGWTDRVRFAGDLGAEALRAELRAADVVVQVARFEAFGMAIAEAVAHGLPVVTAPAGVVDHLPGGSVVVAEDPAPALDLLLGDREARAEQAARARAAASALPGWADQARLLKLALEGLR